MLPRLNILKNSYDLDKVNYFLLPNLNKHFQNETLNLLKIPPERRLSSIKYRHINADQIITTDHPYVFKNDASNEIQNLPNWIIHWLRNSFLNEKESENKSFPKKIYIDRSDAKSNHREDRKIINEKEIIEKLKLNDYKIIRLADLKFIDQVKTNLIFCKPNANILEIKPSGDGNVIRNLANNLNLNFKSLSLKPVNNNYYGNNGHLKVEFQDNQKIFNV